MVPGLRHIALLACLALTGPGAAAQFDRDWRVFIVPFSHTDVGYTAPVPEVLADHHRFLDSVLVYIDRTQALPAGSRFKWTIEIPWILPSYIESRPADRVEALMSRVRSGDVEIGALHFGLQTDLMAPEELVRSLYLTQDLRETYQVPIRTAVLNDTPGATWALAQLLPKSGVPYLSLAMNAELSEFYQTTDLPYLFRWEAQSGDRTLVWRSIHPEWAYLEGAVWGVFGAYPLMRVGIRRLLHDLAAAGYPHDFVLINAATGDNGAPDIRISDNARRWNEEHETSKVIVATFAEFFAHAEASGATIPVYAGDAPNWWSWAFATSATGGFLQSRRVQDLLPVAETLSAVADAVALGFDYPQADFTRAYERLLLYDDHNLGALDPAGHEEFWARKTAWIDEAEAIAAATATSALDALSSRIQTGAVPALAVFNPSVWARSEVVTFGLPPGAGVAVVDVATGEVVPHDRFSDGTAAFLARDVPGTGYRLYRLEPAQAQPVSGPLPGSVLENAHYRVVVDAASGGVTSVFDRAQGLELTRGDGRFNRYLYNGTAAPSGMQIVRSDSGAVMQRLVLRGAVEGSDWIETEIRLYKGVRRIDFLNRYHKRPPTAFEGVDFRFDFGVPAARLRHDIPFGSVRLFDDELSGFRIKHYAAHRWIDVSAGDAGAGALLATRGPAVHAHNTGAFDGRLRLPVSFNTDGTAYRAGVGELVAEFALTSHEAGVAPGVADRFAQAFTRPMPVRLLPPNQSGSLTAPVYSFLSVDSPGLVASTVKRAERGRGTIVRLHNPGPETVDARLISDHPVIAAAEVSPLEAGGIALPTDGSGVTLTLGPHEVKTVRVELSVPSPAEPEVAAVGLVLEPNYPNPFTGETTIGYRLDRPAHVRLTVHDLLGREVAVLVDALQPAGPHAVRWAQTASLAAGFYFYTLSAAGASGTVRLSRPMVLAR